MYLAYFDESGDSGVVNTPTRYFVLACVLVHETHWLDSLDALVDLRRRLRAAYGIQARPEIKSTDLRRGKGPLAQLRWSVGQRMELYTNLMRFVDAEMPHLEVFAVAINKNPAHARGYLARDTAWEFALQRVHNFCQADAGDGNRRDERAMIFPDEGHFPLIRRLVRKMRRHQQVPRAFGGGSFTVPTNRLVEDPNDRQSHDSYFIQLADWAAYAAHRSAYIDPLAPVPTDLWDTLGARRLLAVNAVSGGPPGIKLHP